MPAQLCVSVKVHNKAAQNYEEMGAFLSTATQSQLCETTKIIGGILRFRVAYFLGRFFAKECNTEEEVLQFEARLDLSLRFLSEFRGRSLGNMYC